MYGFRGGLLLSPVASLPPPGFGNSSGSSGILDVIVEGLSGYKVGRQLEPAPGPEAGLQACVMLPAIPWPQQMA